MGNSITNYLAQLVTCSGLDCDAGDLQQLVINVINFLIVISSIIAVVFIIWGGILMLTSAGSADRIAQGKRAMTAAVIGIVIVLISWVLINTFINVFTNCSGAWWRFESLRC
jgi:hypothetical protein